MIEDTQERDQEQIIPCYFHDIWKRNYHIPHDDEEFEFMFPASMGVNYQFSLDTPSGSGDQVRLRDYKNEEKKHLLMVDQLWLWVLDDSEYSVAWRSLSC